MRLHWIWLAERPGISLGEKHALLTRFSDPEDLYAADERVLGSVEWLKDSQRQSLMDKSLDQAEKILEDCVKKKAHILTFYDPEYPALLKQIREPPLLLYYKGTLPAFGEELLVGVVGTRKASAYGLTTARHMAHRISRCGGLVVTGLAYGVDSAAASGALAAGGQVIGVLGCGIDKIYPASNRELYSRVEGQGCLLSEYPPGARVYPSNFLYRNRIISGITQGVLIVEAPEKSGALNTAAWSLEQGRDVFVVPGNINMASCVGSNALLRQGATPVMDGWELVQDYVSRFPGKLHEDKPSVAEEPRRQPELLVAEPRASLTVNPPPPAEKDKKAVDNLPFGAYSGVNASAENLTEGEQALLRVMPMGEQLTDELLEHCGMQRAAALSALTTLALKGYVQTLPGKRVTRIK